MLRSIDVCSCCGSSEQLSDQLIVASSQLSARIALCPVQGMVILDDHIYISAVEVLNRSRAEGRSVYNSVSVVHAPTHQPCLVPCYMLFINTVTQLLPFLGACHSKLQLWCAVYQGFCQTHVMPQSDHGTNMSSVHPARFKKYAQHNEQ